MDENAILNGSMTLDMIYHPVLAQIYRFYQYIMLFSITPLIAFAVYIILKKIPTRNEYLQNAPHQPIILVLCS
jgi:hypothetical protein